MIPVRLLPGASEPVFQSTCAPAATASRRRDFREFIVTRCIRCADGFRPSTKNRVTLTFVETQNITLTLPRELLRQIKRLAADRDTSVSALMVQALSHLADEDRRYSAARRRALAALSQAQTLGTNGSVTWSRDDLHER